MKSLTGSEVNTLSILTLLLGNKKAENIALQRLSGIALKIAKKLIDNKYRCSKDISETTKRLIEWKNSLGH